MHYPSPKQPFPVKAINRMGAVASEFGFGGKPMRADDLIAAASKQTGLRDFGPQTFRSGLEHLLHSLNTEAKLSTIGRAAARRMIVGDLSKRLRIFDYRKKHPEVANEKITQPLIVMGLPRTGTTIFYELLAQDPNHRWPITWAVEDPVPPPEQATFMSDPRANACDKDLERIETLAPGFRAIHAIGARLPQECIAMTASEFASDQYGVMYSIPTYNKWLRDTDLGPAYAYHRMWLQHLQSRFRKTRWVLKSPGHLPFLESIIEEYPDSCFVQTHRNPMNVMASLSSLCCTLHSAFSDEIAPKVTAAHQLEHYSYYLNANLAQRDRIEAREGSGRFFDVHFEDIITNPIAAIEGLYAHFGFEWNNTIRNAMQTYLDKRPRDKHGTHSYTLEEFGLSLDKDGPRFAAYCKRFGITIEG